MQMTDSFLEKMKLSTNSGTNEKQALTSWKSSSDPSVGSFSVSLDSMNIPQVLTLNGTKPYWRSGPWNGETFIGIQGVELIYVYGFVLVDDKAGTVYVTYTSTQRSFMSYYLLKSSGDIVQLHWNSDGSTWQIWVSDCDVYGKCGPFGLCNPKKSPICSCLRGFEPKHNEEWSRGNWSSGCVQKTLLQCTGSTDNSSQASKEDGFFKLKKVKVPDFAVWTSPIEANCSVLCLNNCSCIAYAYHHGIGCMHWSGHLLDLQKFSIGGTDVYLRLAHRDLDEKRNLRTIIAATVMVTIFSVITLCFAWKKVNKQGVKKSLISEETKLGENLAKVSLQELVLNKFEALVVATSNFSNINKLGKGGFGPVYWVMSIDSSVTQFLHFHSSHSVLLYRVDC
ncbi:hypothetical protein BT93_D0579 [Corymbia citriodora subsp. variegata]|nr:hypothetical protein BT93_D0579 [Corymbia citriodora subsp. variegata]